MVKKGEIYYYHLDHLGTPIKLTDAQGKEAWSGKYLSFGSLKIKCDKIENPIRFQGQYFDQESGLHYNRFRYFDPEAGRFIHQDPIGLFGGINHYQYAPNPVQWVDPLGLLCKEGVEKLSTFLTEEGVDEGFKQKLLAAAAVSSLPRESIEALSMLKNRDRALKALERTRIDPSENLKPDFYVGPKGPDATLPSTAYRYDRYLNDDGSEYKWGAEMLKTNKSQITYIGFEKFENGNQAADAFQIKLKKHNNPLDLDDSSWSDARIRGEFDSLQLFDDEGSPKVRVPREFGDKIGAEPETFTKAYPEYGEGGTRQLHGDRMEVEYDKIDILPED